MAKRLKLFSLFTTKNQNYNLLTYLLNTVNEASLSGTVRHSAEFWSADEFENSTVSIVGPGVSGVDIASMIAPKVKQVEINFAFSIEHLNNIVDLGIFNSASRHVDDTLVLSRQTY